MSQKIDGPIIFSMIKVLCVTKELQMFIYLWETWWCKNVQNTHNARRYTRYWKIFKVFCICDGGKETSEKKFKIISLYKRKTWECFTDFCEESLKNRWKIHFSRSNSSGLNSPNCAKRISLWYSGKVKARTLVAFFVKRNSIRSVILLLFYTFVEISFSVQCYTTCEIP